MRILSCSEFKEKLLSGEKRQTIRKKRKYPLRIGEKLQVYWKSRSPLRELLFIAEIMELIPLNLLEVTNEIAIRDGFDCRSDLLVWFFIKYALGEQDPYDEVYEFEIIRFKKIREPKNADLRYFLYYPQSFPDREWNVFLNKFQKGSQWFRGKNR